MKPGSEHKAFLLCVRFSAQDLRAQTQWSNGGEPNISFPSPQFSFFLPLLVVFSWNYGRRGFTRQPESPNGASNTTKIPRALPSREEKRMNIVAGEGGPTEGSPAERGPGGGRRDPWEVSNGGGTAERGLEKIKRKRERNK